MDKREAVVRAKNCEPYSQDSGFTEIPSSDIESCSFPRLDEILSQSADERGLVSLNLEDSERLRDLCEQHAWSEHKFLQLAWALLLRCYTGNDSVCFGLLDHPPQPPEHAKDIRGEGAPCMHVGDLTILASDSFMALIDRFRSENIRVRHQRQKSSSEQRNEPLTKPFDTVVVENGGQSPGAPITGALSGLECFEVKYIRFHYVLEQNCLFPNTKDIHRHSIGHRTLCETVVPFNLYSYVYQFGEFTPCIRFGVEFCSMTASEIYNPLTLDSSLPLSDFSNVHPKESPSSSII